MPSIDNTEFEVVERKGIGHPDTLCDTIAEKVSQAYSQYCLEHYGIMPLPIFIYNGIMYI